MTSIGKPKATLLYRESRDGGDNKTLWNKCYGHEETLTLIKTNHDTIIGCYCSSKIEDTSKIKGSGTNGFKVITGAKPFLFYFDNKMNLQIMKFKDEQMA